jgi:TM2 domain-containing membrane protein YozV
MSTEPVSPVPPPAGAEKKLVAGLLGIFLNCLGIHKFYLGYKKEGLIMLLVSLLTCGIGAVVMWPIGLIEGIIYLTKSDQDFVATYITGRKGWF